MGDPKSQEFLIRNRLPDLETLAGGLGGFCLDAGIGDEESGDIRLAVEEAVSNTIRHGYVDSREHLIRVRATLEDGRIRLEIEDDARAFNPLEAPLPDVSLPVEEKTPGGLGILLLRSVMDRVEYRRSADRNILTMVRSIGRR